MDSKSIRRREFLKRIGYTTGGVIALANSPLSGINFITAAGSDIISSVFYSKNGTPDQNINKLLEIMGGISNFIGKNDIIVLKPNCQWIRQGGTNTSSLKALIDLILSIPGFEGEIIIAENYHRLDSDTAYPNLWTTTDFRFNGPWNINSLIQYYRDNRDQYPAIHDHGSEINISKYMLRDRNQGGRVTTGPSDGDGYVRRTDLVYTAPPGGTEFGQDIGYDSTIMSYPILTSPHSGITIDIKNGCWENGDYIDIDYKLIMLSGLNYHSTVAGVTSAVKNHLGLVELPTAFSAGFADFHTIGFPASGGAVGMHVREINRADLFITTAEWSGHQGRDNLNPVQTKIVLASTDPLALDYWASKHILFPLGGERQIYNDPDNMDGPFRKFLDLYAQEVDWGTLNESEMMVQGFDFNNPTISRFDIDRIIKKFRQGEATEQEVLDLIDQFFQQ